MAYAVCRREPRAPVRGFRGDILTQYTDRTYQQPVAHAPDDFERIALDAPPETASPKPLAMRRMARRVH